MNGNVPYASEGFGAQLTDIVALGQPSSQQKDDDSCRFNRSDPLATDHYTQPHSNCGAWLGNNLVLFVMIGG